MGLKRNLIIGGLAALVAGTSLVYYAVRKPGDETRIIQSDSYQIPWKAFEQDSLPSTEKAVVACAKKIRAIELDTEQEIKQIFKRNRDIAYFIVAPDSPLAAKLGLAEGSFGLYLKGQRIETGDAESTIDLSLEIDHHFNGGHNVIPNCTDALKPGKQAPDFTAVALDGKQVSLKDYQGKVVILDFWATWCNPCVKRIPHKKELFNKYQSYVVFIGISLDSDRSKLEKSVLENQIPYSQICDGIGVKTLEGPLATKYQIVALPETCIIDRTGRIAARWGIYWPYPKDETKEEAEIQRIINIK